MESLLDANQIDGLLASLADEIVADGSLFSTEQEVALVGVRSRGELLAQRLASLIAQRRKSQHPIDVGALDITFYRDDLASRRAITVPQGTEMNFILDDRAIVLVDDVLATGRSARAALDALVDFGRPSIIRLAVLIDRGGREFPIAADFVGLHIPHAEAGQKIVVQLRPADPHDGVYLQ